VRLPETLFASVLALASVLVYFFRPELGDTRRWILALVAIGFFFAPLSPQRLRVVGWLAALAAVCWGASLLSGGRGGFGLWSACSLAGALLTVRAGGRAGQYYLPGPDGQGGSSLRRSVRRELSLSVALFLIVFVSDGWGWVGVPTLLRGVLLFASAAFFLRSLLLQSKGRDLPVRAPLGLGDPDVRRSIVAAQRWPVLVLLTLSGATHLFERLLERAGSNTEALLVTSILLLVLAALLFVFSLVRLEVAGRISRRIVRRTSFLAGMALAIALGAVVVELEAWGPSRFTSFGTICMFALVVLPFAHETTGLLGSDERFTFLAPPVVLAIMMAPVAAINGERWRLASTGFLLAFAALMLLYFLVVTLWKGERGTIYLGTSLAGLLLTSLSNGEAWASSGGAWKTFWIAFGFVLYAVDLLERATVVARVAGKGAKLN
jgi:hypothetical protein